MAIQLNLHKYFYLKLDTLLLIKVTKLNIYTRKSTLIDFCATKYKWVGPNNEL